MVARANVRCMSVNWNVSRCRPALLLNCDAAGKHCLDAGHRQSKRASLYSSSRASALRNDLYYHTSCYLLLQDKERAAEKAWFNQEDEKLLRVRTCRRDQGAMRGDTERMAPRYTPCMHRQMSVLFARDLPSRIALLCCLLVLPACRSWCPRCAPRATRRP